MIARLKDSGFAVSEAERVRADALRITDSNGKHVFMDRTGISLGDIRTALTDAMNAFDGDVMVQMGRGNITDLKYVLVCGGKGTTVAALGMPSQLAGGMVPLSDHLRTMQDLFAARLDLERARADKPEPDYFQHGAELLKALLTKPASPGTPTSAHPPQVAQPNTNEADDDQPDAADRFYEAEPEADALLDKLLKLKQTNPALYEQAKAFLSK
jgi:hypothetical protein